MKNKQQSTLRKAFTLGIVGLGMSLLSQASLAAKDYLVTAVRPNKLVVVDAEARQVVKTHEIPNTAPGNSVAGIAVSRDGKVAYAIHNRWESVSGIDLDTGKEVFRAELSTPDIRAKAHFAIDVSPDGKELAVYVNPTRLKPGEYEVLDPYIAIYDTGAGTNAQPVRKLPAPRRATTLAYSPDYKRLYTFTWDMLVLDPKTGEQIGSHPWKSWKREGYGEPDSLSVSPQFEQANEFATPYFITHKDKDGKESLRAGIWALDIEKDRVRFSEFEDATVMFFSTAINPVRRNEAYTVYTQLTKTDLDTNTLLKRVDLDHTFYTVNVSSDGKELYIGGTINEIVVHDSDTLEKKGTIIVGRGDQVLSSMRLVRR
ncbi:MULTISPECIES: quinohemoprotein amine dehydrogenase subunit beta [Thauera]|uniref:quinohemoprotein amine dehydrogenase subunit beta n=1 Tax=Thauera TaxID=33057 RepID=UPI0008386456|nr:MULTISPECIES: quinohemoprotein amine dehydrogenase subunit beta [Thauera]MDD3674096.1 quinohemoprotein amine dehydrogenase subunit beta [Thauera propionica]